MSIKIVDLEFKGDPPNIYCPVCGEEIYAEDEEPSCEHVIVLSYPCDKNEVLFIAPRIKEQIASIIEKANKDNMDYNETIKTVLKELNSTSILCFSITTSGIARAPSSSKVYVAVDFCPLNKRHGTN